MQLDMFSPYKLLLHQEILDKTKKGELIYPISCEIDLTNLCNHKCIWCLYEDFRRRAPMTLPKDKVFDILMQFKEKGLKAVAYAGGGEPLIHRDVIEILRFTQKQDIQIAMVTNGGLMTEKIADTLLDTATFVKFSVDAGTDETYEKLHHPRGHNLSDVFRWIKYMGKKKVGTAIGLAYLIHPINYHEVYMTAKMARDAGASYIQIRPVLLPGLQFSDEVYSEIMRQIELIEKLQTSTFKPYIIMHRFREVQKHEKMFDRCLGHALEGVVTATGDMYLCCIFRGVKQFCLGNIYKQSLTDIWEGQRRKDSIAKIDLDKCPPCRYSKYNEILCYLSGEKKHKNFL